MKPINLNLRRRNQNLWTPEEDARLRQYLNTHGRLTKAVLAHFPGRSRNSIEGRRQWLGLHSNNKKRELNHHGKKLLGKGEGVILPCLRCQRNFKSWDRKKNRLCRFCLDSINGMGSSFG